MYAKFIILYPVAKLSSFPGIFGLPDSSLSIWIFCMLLLILFNTLLSLPPNFFPGVKEVRVSHGHPPEKIEEQSI